MAVIRPILIFGPPRSGKSTTARILSDRLSSVAHSRVYSIGRIITSHAEEIFGRSIPDEDKDTPIEVGSTWNWRNPLIHIGELDIYLPRLWSDNVVRRIRQFEESFLKPDDVFYPVLESCGKWDQAESFLEQFSYSCVFLELIKDGVTWSDNRRGFRVPLNYRKFTLHNDGTIAQLEVMVGNLAGMVHGSFRA